jgi:hypothetical protein
MMMIWVLFLSLQPSSLQIFPHSAAAAAHVWCLVCVCVCVSLSLSLSLSLSTSTILAANWVAFSQQQQDQQ